MPLLAALVLGSLLAQDLANTYGKTNAQILAMGRAKWFDFYTKHEGGESTAGMASAEGTYGDALAWRNDRIKPKATALRLRKLLQATGSDAGTVGSTITGGGTMWNITGAALFANAEEAVYAVVTRTGAAPRRKVSDVTKALERTAAALAAVRKESWFTPEGDRALARLRRDVAGIVAEAKALPRRESDVLLDFAKKTVEAARGGAE